MSQITNHIFHGGTQYLSCSITKYWPNRKNVDMSGSTRQVSVPHEISRFRDRGKNTEGSASASDKLKVIMK
jgi:hypothetical protein